MSPSHNSSLKGQAHLRRTSPFSTTVPQAPLRVFGDITWQRAPLIGHPLSLLPWSTCWLCPSPEPLDNWKLLERTRPPWIGPARGHAVVSRTLGHEPSAAAPCDQGETRRLSLYKCLVQSPLGP